MKKITYAFIFCLIAFTSSFGQSKQESIKELFHIMKTDSMVDKMTTTMLAPMQKQMQTQLKDVDSQVKFNQTMNSMMTVVKDITRRMMNEDMVALYSKYFTQAEIDDFIRFYKTPSGQKYINAMPEVTKELMTIMMQKYVPEIQKVVVNSAEKK